MNRTISLGSAKRILHTLLLVFILFNFGLCYAQYDEIPTSDTAASTTSQDSPHVERINNFIVWIVTIFLVVVLYFIFLTSIYRSKLINGEHPVSAAASTITYWLIIAWLILSIASSNVINWDFSNVTLSNLIGFFIVSGIFIVLMILVSFVKPNKE